MAGSIPHSIRQMKSAFMLIFFIFNIYGIISTHFVKMLPCSKICPVNSVKKSSELIFCVLLQKQRHGEYFRKLDQRKKNSLFKKELIVSNCFSTELRFYLKKLFLTQHVYLYFNWFFFLFEVFVSNFALLLVSFLL